MHNIAIWDITENNLIYYVCWRYKNTKNFGDSINQQVSAIVSTYNKHYPHTDFKFIERKTQWKKLPLYIESIKRKPGRHDSTPKEIIDNALLLQLVSTIDTSFNGQAIRCVFLFAKFFGLRISDYAYNKKNKHYLTWSQVKLFNHKGLNAIQFKTTIGKHNQKRKTEILVWICTCRSYSPNICLACNMVYYKNILKKKFRYILPSDPVFVWDTGSIIENIDVYNNLKKYLILIGRQPSKYLSPHSFRYGCITDLMRWGVPEWIVKKFARHSPKSQMTFHYTQTSANEETTTIHVYLKQFYNKNNSNNRP